MKLVPYIARRINITRARNEEAIEFATSLRVPTCGTNFVYRYCFSALICTVLYI